MLAPGWVLSGAVLPSGRADVTVTVTGPEIHGRSGPFQDRRRLAQGGRHDIERSHRQHVAIKTGADVTPRKITVKGPRENP